MGACFDCLVTVDGKPGPARLPGEGAAGGMVVGSAAPDAPAPLAPTAGGDRRPRLRRAGGRRRPGRAGRRPRPQPRRARRVVVLDERGEAGGQYLKPLAASHAHAAPDRAVPPGRCAARRGHAAAGAEILTGATVWGGFAPDEIAALVGDAAVTFRPRRLVLAAGAHERPVPMPGWTLPGVMTTGAMQTLARANRVSPGRARGDRRQRPAEPAARLRIAGRRRRGGGGGGGRAAARAWRSGDRRRRCCGPRRTWPGTGWPICASCAPPGCRCSGAARRSAARARAASPRCVLATPAGERRIAADACALNLGFQPETGLARALGAAHRFVG